MRGFRTYRVVTVVLAGAVAAALTLPAGGIAASDEAETQPDRDGQRQSVTSGPISPAPKHLRGLAHLAQSQPWGVVDRWFAASALTGATTEPTRKHWQGKVPRKRMPRSVGKLYTLNGMSIGECTAFAVRDPKFRKQLSYVVTAGHCLLNPRTRDWVDHVEFYPKYYKKPSKKYGVWNAKRFRVYNKWYYKGSWKYDVGVVKLERKKKRQIADVVGGSRLAYGAKPGHKRVRFIGYPAAGKYDGRFPYQCVGPAHRDSKRKWMTVMPCATREGASGGPWFTKMLNRHTGLAYAALSRGTSSGKRIITAAPFKKSLRRLAFKEKWR